MGKVVILDTNVLLADPNAILSFPRAEVVIPETVLGELDKLKTARVDPDLRFRGREVSRMLFELSEDGSLVDGVELPDGGSLRVASYDTDAALPSGFSTRNSDDRILATVYQIWSAAGKNEADVTLITNDLNMLLKAQTLGIPVERHGEGVEGGFARRYIIRPFQRYRTPITILAVAIAVFIAVIAIAIYTQQRTGSAGLPAEFKSLLSTQQTSAYEALVTLQDNPDDPEALLAMANYYYDVAETARAAGQQSTLFQVAPMGIRYFGRYLEVAPQDNEARSDYASLLFYNGQTDQAIRQVGTVLSEDPNHINANFNLGIFYWQKGSPDYQSAASQMEKVISLTKDDSQQHAVYQQAVLVLEQIKQDAAAAGRSVETTATEGTVQ